MRARRGLVRLEIADGAPPLLTARMGLRAPTPFGRWLLERVASAMLDWPTVAFHRVEVTRDGVEVALLLGSHAPPRAQLTAVADALARELDLGAQRRGWVNSSLWRSVTVALEATGIVAAIDVRR